MQPGTDELTAHLSRSSYQRRSRRQRRIKSDDAPVVDHEGVRSVLFDTSTASARPNCTGLLRSFRDFRPADSYPRAARMGVHVVNAKQEVESMSPSSPAPDSYPSGDERSLTMSECRRWLHQHGEGRLGYLSGRGPRSVVVSYAVADDQILMQVPDYNDIAQYAPGAEVTLAVDGEVEGTSADEPAIDEVSVTGTAAHADQTHRPPADAVRFDESWPIGIKTCVVSLPLTQVDGVERRADLRRA
jgi:hypothetical protein